MADANIFDEDVPPDRPVFDVLCNLCTSIFNSQMAWVENEYRNHHNIRALASSAEAGCHLCSLMLARVSPKDILDLQKELDESPDGLTQQIGVNIRGQDTLTLWVAAWKTRILPKGWDTCKNGWTGIARFHVRAQEDDYTQEMRSTARQNFSKSAVAQISLWIEQCDSPLHSLCRKVQAITTTRKMLPTRLLDLVSAFEDNRIRLCSSESLRVGVKYATLSHCWGGHCEPKLMVKTLQRFEAGIPLDDLPNNFRDAVLVTRELGLRYLWIDALCIIQDSEDDADWLKEASMMGDVYANSHITLAATTSIDSTGGLLHRRSPLSVWPCRVTATWSGFAAGALVVSVPDWADQTDLEPLASRSWAYQEWLLSKRLLHFGIDQVRWQCFSLAASEVYPGDSDGDDAELDTYGTGVQSTTLDDYGIPTKSTVVSLMQNPQLASDCWGKIREDYSRKALTRAGDRLPALTGIARMVHKAIKSSDDDYLAGLWKPHLPQELLWQRADDISTTPGSDDSYIAPTWSWASLKAPFLCFPSGGKAEELRWLVDVVDAKTTTVSDPFGSVRGGTLTLKCSLSCITARLLHVNSDETTEPTWTIGSVNRVADNYGCSLRLDHPPPSPIITPSTFCFMPIRASFWYDPKQNATAGLLLEETSGRRGQYRRIGLLNIFGAKNQQSLLSNLEKGAASGENLYLETESRAERLIEIV